MSEELFLVFGLILAVGAIGYLFATGTMNLSAQQIAAFAANAGFTGDDIVTATAIALAESSGNPQAKGDKTTGAKNFGGAGLPIGTPTSYGLWQVHWTVHPEVLNGADPSVLFDPQANANAAFVIFQEQGFNAWSTFDPRDGSTPMYLAHLSAAQDGANA